MKTKPTQTKSNTDRRRFLKLAGATLLAGAALPKAAQASINHFGGDFTDGTSNTYFGGVVTSAAGPGAILNVYLAVDADGTGVGTVSDTIHSQLNAHLEVRSGGRKGNAVRFEGVVRAANDAALVGKAFVVAGVVTENFTSLALRLDDATFTGKGFFVSAPQFITPIGSL